MESVVYVTWYVVFTKQDVNRHLIHRILRKPFYHCYCFRQIGDHIYYANPTTSNIDTKIYQEVSAEELAQEISRQSNTKILKFKYRFDIKNKIFNIYNMAPTCVSAVKMFLGISAKAQTPYQLYKHLLKLGAKLLTANDF
jgi:hypothetical protein